jgi:Tfp pilus assembly protein PilO
MASLSRNRKSIIRWSVVAILAADLGLLGYNVFRQAPTAEAQRADELQLDAQRVRLRDDVKRAQGFRDRLPEVGRQGDIFYNTELRPAASGYSGIVSDLNGIAKEAGLRTNGLSFTQKEVGNRGIMEIQITGTVEGAYPNLVSFINGLERSNSFYVLESLELASSSGSELRMNLRLRTYFRT